MEKTTNKEGAIQTETKKEEMEYRAQPKELLQELSEVIADTFVGTYQMDDNSLIMRIPNGQAFRIIVEEVEEFLRA